MSKMIPSYLHAIVPAVNVGEVCVVGRGGACGTASVPNVDRQSYNWQDNDARQFLFPARPGLGRLGCGKCRVPCATMDRMARRSRPETGQGGQGRLSESRVRSCRPWKKMATRDGGAGAPLRPMHV